MAIWKSSFEGDWRAAWSTKFSWGSANAQKISVPDRMFLRVAYPQGSINPGNKNAPTGGCSFKSGFSLSTDFIWLRYDVRFPVGFDFVKGGKLPGLYGGTAPSGGKIPNGVDGWSARLMWRPDGAGEVYAYLPTSQTWGTRLLTGKWHFPPDGQWHTVEMCLKLNTPGQSDGFAKVYFDGDYKGYAGNLRFRDVADLQINGVWFETFFGGNTSDWASPSDQHADFSRFAVDYNRIEQYPSAVGGGEEEMVSKTEFDAALAKITEVFTLYENEQTTRKVAEDKLARILAILNE